MYGCMDVWMDVWMYVCICLYICLYMSVHVCICLYACLSVCTSVRTYVCVCICDYISSINHRVIGILFTSLAILFWGLSCERHQPGWRFLNVKHLYQFEIITQSKEHINHIYNLGIIHWQIDHWTLIRMKIENPWQFHIIEKHQLINR